MRVGDQSGIPFLLICSEQGQRKRYNLASPGTLALGGKTLPLALCIRLFNLGNDFSSTPPCQMAAFPTLSPEPDTHVISMDWFSRSGRKGVRQKLAKVRDQPQVEHLGYPLALGQPLRHPEPEMERTRWEPSDAVVPPPTLKRQNDYASVSSGMEKRAVGEWREGDPGAGGGVSGEREGLRERESRQPLLRSMSL